MKHVVIVAFVWMLLAVSFALGVRYGQHDAQRECAELVAQRCDGQRQLIDSFGGIMHHAIDAAEHMDQRP